MIRRSSVVIGLLFPCLAPCLVATGATADPAPAPGAAPAPLAPAEVVFTTIAGHPTAAVPEKADLSFRAGDALGRPAASADGRRWIIVVGVTDGAGQPGQVVLVGDGGSAAVVAATGQAAPGSGGQITAFSPGVSIDDRGVFGFEAMIGAGETQTPQRFRGQLISGRVSALAPAADGPAPEDAPAPIETINPEADVQTVAFTPDAIIVSPSGDWLIRGMDATGSQWVFRNGEPVASAGAPVTLAPHERIRFEDPGEGPAFFSMQANAQGDVIVGGRTDEDGAGFTAAVILNSQRILLRQGDRVDLNGDGVANDDAYLSGFDTDGAFLAGERYYFTAEISSAAGRVLGRGLFRASVCKPDWNASGVPDSSDVSAFISEWLVSVTDGCPLADYDRDGLAGNSDVASFLADWLSAVGGGC